MKFLELPSLDALNHLLSYANPEQQVIGRCELYTTKAAGPDKKLYKYLNKQLEERYLSDLALSNSLSPPSPPSPTSPLFAHTIPTIATIPGVRRRRRSSLSPIDKRDLHGHDLATNNHSTGQSLPVKIPYGPFGPLDTVSSRKTLMYLIATLNATHSYHDFSSMSPQSFRRERNVRYVLSHILPPTNPSVQSDFLAILEREMDWRPNGPNPDCTVYSVDEATMMDALPVGTVWCTTLFWVNKKLKRVLFLGVQGRSITSPVLGAADEMYGWDEDESILGEFEIEL